jgi:hypothetical protein
VTNETLPIVERLRAEIVLQDDSDKTVLLDLGDGPVEVSCVSKTVRLRNPDGFEAADTIEHLVEALEFYANPEIYKPHPHGPAFDRRNLSFKAVSVLQSVRSAA